MNNLSEDILMRYLTGECSDEDFARVNAWIKESDDNARRLFRMEGGISFGQTRQLSGSEKSCPGRSTTIQETGSGRCT